MKYLFCCAVIFLASCAKDSDSKSAQKSIFSIWTKENNSFSVDLNGASFNVPFPLRVTMATHEECTTSLTFSGSQDSGSYSFSGSSYVSGTGSGVDPGCNGLNEVGTYSREGVALKFCENGGTCTLFY